MKLIRMRGAKSAGPAYMGRFTAICSLPDGKNKVTNRQRSGNLATIDPEATIALALPTPADAL
ncbi:hypothetical protein HT585_07880 [Ensifer sp. HO-A22]|uniref:Uncharacterized protein n=1 Tax=Ensifer oleiphilus TaxID=2742698 RepID=A0A7Y6Q480_9HYPH|nr:hypothetical protein [Ensifer oleiphilus]NVD38768.1 hypothetical protein [Ensifer oleiphilus]